MKSAYPRVFVCKLDQQVTDSELYEFFSRWCTVRSAKVVLDKETGESRCFGFVELETEQDVKTALELNGYQFNGRRIKVEPTREK